MINNIPFFANLKLANINDSMYSEGLSILNNTTPDLLRECSLANELDGAAQGTGLAFIVFTQAIVELPGAPFWAVIFFMMLLSLGIGSQIGILEGMLCTIFDIEIFKRIRKQYVTGE
jgi:solute carrier family 6 amino acid/orphan transporter-like 15/16/17/18/20